MKKMPLAQKDKLVKAIQDSSPEIAAKIEQNLFHFDDIADLTPQSVQILLKEVDQKDLVLSLKAASAKVKEALYRNMSQRKRQIVDDDLKVIGQTPLAQVQEAQRRILDKIDELRQAGAVRSAGVKDVWI